MYYLQRFYLPVKGGEVQKLWSYSVLQVLATVPVPVTEPGTGAKFSSGRVLII